METYKHENSAKLFERALKVIPAGVYGHKGPAEGCFIPVDAYPFFSDHAKGAYFWDVDGQRYVDYMCGYGPNILGYNDEDVDAAAIAQLKKENCVSSPSYMMVEFAEALCDTVDMADWAFFAKNGGDVTSLAVMTARAATGRKKLIRVKGAYHGVAPWTQKMGYPGIVEEDVANNLFVHWNDFDELERVVRENDGQVAAMIATPYHHPVFEDNELPAEGYWRKVRKLCTEKGIVLIIDDIRCGFRLDVGGSDKYFGFKADLMCFCKALANGYNVSALAGVDALRGAVAGVTYTGSYWLSAEPFAAGIVCLKKMREIDAAKVCQAQGKKLTDGLAEVAKRNGYNLKVTGVPSMWYMRIADDDSLCLHQKWVAECVRRGVFFANHHNLFINCALSDADMEFTLDVADEAFHAMQP